MRYDLALTGVQLQTEAHFASLRHYLLNICSHHTLTASQSEIIQITIIIFESTSTKPQAGKLG